MDKFPAWSEDARRMVEERLILGELVLHGWPHEWRHGDRARAESEALAALNRLIALGLPHRRTAQGQRLFDPVEVSNFLDSAGLNRSDPIWLQNYLPAQRRLIFDTHNLPAGEAPPPSPLTLGDRRYRVTLQRRFNLAGLRPDKRVRLNLPVPREGAELDNLQIEFLPPDHGNFDTRSAPGRLEILADIPPEQEISAGMRATFTARPSPSPGSPAILSAQDAELYTRPIEGLIRVTERIRALADRLAGNEMDPSRTIRRFWDFIMSELYIDAIHHDLLAPTAPLDTALDRAIVNCIVGSALAVGLCRARGIPARIVTGYVLNICAPGYHSWFEVWVAGSGWLSFDLLGWDLTTDHNQPNAWRDYYFGQVEHRMVVERPPRIFVGSSDVRLPARWHILNRLHGAGTMIEFRSMDSGELIYSEHITVEWLDRPDMTITPGAFDASSAQPEIEQGLPGAN